MLSAEEIKKCIEEFKPDGFEYIEPIYEGIAQIPLCLKDPENRYIVIDLELERSISYPLFLQKVIEGINRSNPEWIQIAQCGYSMQVLKDCNRYVVLNIDMVLRNDITIDQAKEQAIKYILEKIK